MKKLRDFIIKKRTVLLICVGVLLIFTLSLSFAYFAGFIGDAANTDVNVTTGTTRKLTFEKGDALTLSVNQDNFGEGDGSLSQSTTMTATLKKASTESSASETYQVYFDILNNSYVYTTSDKKPEIILSITDPAGNKITMSNEAEYVTVTDAATGDSISGFDITEKSGLLRLAENYSISTTGTTNQTWAATITFVNLETNQGLNEAKSLSAEFNMQKNIEPVRPDLFISTPEPYYVGKSVSINCNGANATWNSYRNSVEITSLKSESKCTLTQNESASVTPLDDYIVSLAGTTQGTGEVVNENGYRYEGKNPNNFIWFNEEMWRVIGVFDTTLADGTTTERLTKIIKADSIGGIAWDSGRVNNWNESTLKSLLNTSYLNSENGTGTENCYGYSTTVPTNCDYTQSGIKNEYKSMIENVTWNLGGFSLNNITASAAFAAERGTTVYSGNPTTGTGYIGLMYPSDYFYSSLESSCARNTTISYYGKSTCGGANWIYGAGNEWILTPSSSNSSNAWILNNSGGGVSMSSDNGLVVRPVLYLNSEVKYLDGVGSEANPLTLEI